MSYTEKIFEFAQQWAPDLYYVTVIEDGKSTTKCFGPCNLTNDAYSVSKFFTATAIGMLWDQGKLHMDDKIVDIFRDELPGGMDPKMSLVTLDMLLRHRWGLGENYMLNIDTDNLNRFQEEYGERNDFLKIALRAPLPKKPGVDYQYSNTAFYLLSRAAAKVSGQDIFPFLRERLFNPLEFEEYAWSTCPMGYAQGGTGLYIRCWDMAKLGRLYLNHGTWEGKRILSKAWCDLAFERGYSLEKSEPAGYFKGGMNGQMLFMDAKLDLVAAWMGHDENGYTDPMLDFAKGLSQ